MRNAPARRAEHGDGDATATYAAFETELLLLAVHGGSDASASTNMLPRISCAASLLLCVQRDAGTERADLQGVSAPDVSCTIHAEERNWLDSF